MKFRVQWTVLLAAVGLVATALWLRWPTFDHSLWNVDEAIHAAAARVLLEGGVMYRDAIDQRTPLTYHAIAGLFALFGENNLWAARCAVALMIAATGFLLFLTGRKPGRNLGGLIAGFLYVVLGSAALFQGDANAINTEWFVAFFTAAAAAVIFSGNRQPGLVHALAAGALLGGAFLSKQPALLEVAAPLALLAYFGWREQPGLRWLISRFAAGAAGWLAVVALAALPLIWRGAWSDAVFYTWTYNLEYYGPETSLVDRLEAFIRPFQLVASVSPLLIGLWGLGAIATVIRLVQRTPAAAERSDNPFLAYLAVWSAASLAGAASGGRDFQHYAIQFLPAFCLGAGLALAGMTHWIRRTSSGNWPRKIGAGALLAIMIWQVGTTGIAGRSRTLPADPSARIADFIREHSTPADRIFVWGYHPDIYYFSDRKPASRFLYASFLTGLIPWTNVAPGRDTTDAIVPGAMEDLLADLQNHQPQFIVDCSAGPNRHWSKYPPDNFPAFHEYLQTHYTQVAPEQFVPQGFRLYQRRSTAAEIAVDETTVPAATMAGLTLGILTTPLHPVSVRAPYGVSHEIRDGRLEFFVHAPSVLSYRLTADARSLRGSFGIRPAAYASDNQGPTDGAEFVVRWAPDGSAAGVLFRRFLNPRSEPADRGLQSFRVEIPPSPAGGLLSLEINPGPADNNASDWTFWSDLMLENYH